VKAKGCLIGAAVGLGLIALFLALLGPTLVREGGRIIGPIAKIKGEQNEFEAWAAGHRFKAPESVTVSAEQLDRFLKLRRLLDALDQKSPLRGEVMERDRPPTLAEVGDLIEGVGGSVAGQMAAHREASMPPAEYHYLERIIYRTWLRPLRAGGLDPLAVARAAKALNDLAASEKDAAIAGRLTRLAQGLVAQRVPLPEGFPAEVHALLLARAAEIDALIDVGPAIPMRGGR